jgi:hypothetical protein
VCAIGKPVTELGNAKFVAPKLLHRLGVNVNQDFVTSGSQVAAVDRPEKFTPHQEKA